MAKSVLYMSMSLDGFIAGAGDGPGNGQRAFGQELELTRVIGAPDVTHLRSRVVSPADEVPAVLDARAGA